MRLLILKRKIYDFYTNKDIAVHFICDYVKKIARETVYADLATGSKRILHCKDTDKIIENPIKKANVDKSIAFR